MEFSLVDVIVCVLIGSGLAQVGVVFTENPIKFLICDSILLGLYAFVVRPLLGIG